MLKTALHRTHERTSEYFGALSIFLDLLLPQDGHTFWALVPGKSLVADMDSTVLDIDWRVDKTYLPITASDK